MARQLGPTALGILLCWAHVCVPAALAEPPAEMIDTEAPPTVDESDESGSHAWGEPAEPSGPVQPARVIATVTGGTSFRAVQNVDFQQERMAPGFVEVLGGFVFSTAAKLRHGVALSAGINVSGDGNTSIGMDPLTQLLVTPSYLAYLRLNDDLVVTGHGGPTFGVTSQPDGTENDIGFEVAGGASYLLLAGLGVFGELTISAFLGGESTVHPLISGEVGVYMDIEVLP